MIMQGLDRFCCYGNFGTKINKIETMVEKLPRFECLGTKL
jgi:hypothetical protein